MLTSLHSHTHVHTHTCTHTQIDRRLRESNAAPKYCGDVRITDSNTLRIVKEEAGYARCEIESILSRGFKGGNIGAGIVLALCVACLLTDGRM
jgi:acetylglutamate kinase